MSERICFAYLTKDRVSFTQQTIHQVLKADCDVFWVDGSETEEGLDLPFRIEKQANRVVHGIRGGPDAALAYALSELLEMDYDLLGVIENDILLQDGWLEKMLSAKRAAERDGLRVGSISCRTFADRVLMGRDDYAVMHNSGAGIQLFTRGGARCVLDTYRTGQTRFNRHAFRVASGIDIGGYWAFRYAGHSITADWHWNAALVHFGYASISTVPNMATILETDLAAMGLRYVSHPVAGWANPRAFDKFVTNTNETFERGLDRADAVAATMIYDPIYKSPWTVLNHHIAACIPHAVSGGWRLQWNQGFGPWTFVSTRAGANITLPLYGTCDVLAGGVGGEIHAQGQSRELALKDNEIEGHSTSFDTVDEDYRILSIVATQPGLVWSGIQSVIPQPWATVRMGFTYNNLPPWEEE